MCRSKIDHPNAVRIGLYIAQAGSEGLTDESNRDIGKALGLSDEQFREARNHSRTCPEVPWVIPYRKRGAPLALLDPSTRGSLKPHRVRIGGYVTGWAKVADMVRTYRDRGAAYFEAAAQDALGKGDKDFARWLLTAAADIARAGEVHEATWDRLQALSAQK